ncbi:uncharacterized protein TNCV_4770191 [Trichonephila clavipes]|nr:uncharacterized protein TNCV_4770191 [Trichonephila clavipes]
MALKLNLKKDELISVAVEMGLVIPSKAKIIDLKKLIESSAVNKNDIEFVRSLVENALEKSKQEAEKNEREAEKNEREAEKNEREAEKNKREAEIQLEKVKLSQIEKQLELEEVRKESEKNPQTLESGEPSSITDKLESLVKSIKTLTIQVPVRSESFNLFFHSLEKAFQIKSVPDELKAEMGGGQMLVRCEVKEDVFETISRFRRHKFAFTTDIQKMYRQILINPDQQDLQRIIWKNGLDAEILTYRLKTVTYGLSNAPFLAIRTLQQLAKDEKSRFP